MALEEPRLLKNWRFFMNHFQGDLMSGPFSQVLVVSTQLGWYVDPPFVVDHDGASHHIVLTDNQTWDTLITDAWYQYVSRQVQHPKTMSDLCGLDPHLVRVPSRTAAALKSSSVSSLQSGCFIGANKTC